MVVEAGCQGRASRSACNGAHINPMPHAVDWSTFSYDISGEELAECVFKLGEAILAFSTLEIQVARMLSAAFNTHVLPHGDALVGTVDAISKVKMLNGLASIYGSDLQGIIKDYKPVPELRARLKDLAKLFEGLLKQRNVMAHGTLAKCDGRLILGSTQLSARLRANGGSDSWVYFDEMSDYHRRCRAALAAAAVLRTDFETAYGKLSAVGVEAVER